jgi:hypothetical protein
MSGNRPQISIQFRDKEAGKTYEVGVIFLDDQGRGSFAPCLEDKTGDFPKMALSKALELNSEKKGFLNVWAIGKGNRINVSGANEEF